MSDRAARLRRLLMRPRALRTAAPDVATPLRDHPRVAGAVATAALAAGAATVFVRRVFAGADVPLPGALAQATAVSVWDASKGSVIEAVRDAGDAADADVVARTAHAAVLEAARAGAHVTAAALGAVEGALAVTHLLHATPRAAATAAADAATEAAGTVGEHARVRVSRALHQRFPTELHSAD